MLAQGVKETSVMVRDSHTKGIQWEICLYTHTIHALTLTLYKIWAVSWALAITTMLFLKMCR